MLLEDWEITADHLKLLDKKLGEGQFGIVKRGLLTTENGDPEDVAVKTLKGNREFSLSQLLRSRIVRIHRIIMVT